MNWLQRAILSGWNLVIWNVCAKPMLPISIPTELPPNKWSATMESEAFTYLRALLALAFVICLIYLFAAIVRKTGLDKRFVGGNSSVKRLSLVETMYIDPKRRVVLIKCDEKEHLLLLGANGDVVLT